MLLLRGRGKKRKKVWVCHLHTGCYGAELDSVLSSDCTISHNSLLMLYSTERKRAEEGQLTPVYSKACSLSQGFSYVRLKVIQPTEEGKRVQVGLLIVCCSLFSLLINVLFPKRVKHMWTEKGQILLKKPVNFHNVH